MELFQYAPLQRLYRFAWYRRTPSVIMLFLLTAMGCIELMNFWMCLIVPSLYFSTKRLVYPSNQDLLVCISTACSMALCSASGYVDGTMVLEHILPVQFVGAYGSLPLRTPLSPRLRTGVGSSSASIPPRRRRSESWSFCLKWKLSPKESADGPEKK